MLYILNGVCKEACVFDSKWVHPADVSAKSNPENEDEACNGAGQGSPSTQFFQIQWKVSHLSLYLSSRLCNETKVIPSIMTWLMPMARRDPG